MRTASQARSAIRPLSIIVCQPDSPSTIGLRYSTRRRRWSSVLSLVAVSYDTVDEPFESGMGDRPIVRDNPHGPGASQRVRALRSLENAAMQ